MPYGWFEPPKTIRIDTKFGRQQMVYRDLADDAIANGINHLTGLTMRLRLGPMKLSGRRLRAGLSARAEAPLSPACSAQQRFASGHEVRSSN
jgi:hypothetical protein